MPPRSSLAAAGGAPAPIAAAKPPPARVMLVDDNRDAADSMALLLGFLGAELHVEHDGCAALAALAARAAWQPQLMLLDIGMPRMDGYEVARRIRADRRFDGLRLVALTGWGQAEDRERTLAAGFDDHLVKPADLNLLQALLASLHPHRGCGPSSGMPASG